MGAIGSRPLATAAWLELDLLRRRREALGLKAPRPVPTRALLWRGGLLGGGLVLLMLLACLATLLYVRWLEQRQVQLAPAAALHAQTQDRLARTSKELETLKGANRALAQAIAGVRSGSALLTELSRLIPQGVQFSKLKVDGATLEVGGVAQQPLGLELVNAFQLQLESSPFFQPQNVNLVNASEVVTPPPPTLNFTVRAGLAADAPARVRRRLVDLGSLGLARRVTWLEREGLLP